MNKGPRRVAGRLGAFGFAVLAVSAALASCTETVTPPTPSPPAVSIAAPAPSTSASPSPTPPPAPVNPLTGLAPVPAGTVIGVKIDDTSNGRPQRGVDLADIVYIEQAEGGLSRLLAVFATNKPVVEPVRSVRASDPELLAQYGPMTLVASGGGGDALPTLYASPLHAVIDDRGDKGFARDNRRNQPYNLTSDLAAVTANVATGAPVQSIGFTWSPVVPVGSPGTTLSTKVGSTAVTFGYDAASGRYIRSIGGVMQKAADGNFVSTPNVIVQFCQITPNPGDRDVNGVLSQYTHTIGSGPVSVFRNGQRVDGTWSRATAGVGTTLRSAAGAPIALNPGNTWVVLVATGTVLTSS